MKARLKVKIKAQNKTEKLQVNLVAGAQSPNCQEKMSIKEITGINSCHKANL